MHTARTKFIEPESSERIRRALRKKVRSYADVKYESGDKVFYKRKGMKGWRGPANVLEYDGTVELVRHGTAYYRCHPCHLLKVSQAKITQKSRKDINDTPGYKKCSSDEQEEATENDATDSGDSDENSGSEEEDRSCSENETESQERDETVDEETSDETVDEFQLNG